MAATTRLVRPSGAAGHRHRQRGRLVRAVRDGADRHQPDGAVGWASAMQWLGVLVLLACRRLGCSRAIPTAAAQAAPRVGPEGGWARARPLQALARPATGYLAAGFLVCGFHVAFLATHLPGVIAACGLPTQWGAGRWP
jgi:hypothetical protein